MAKNQDNQEKEKDKQKGDKNTSKSLMGKLLPVIILTTVIVLASGSGFFLGRLFARQDTVVETDSNSVPLESSSKIDSVEQDGESWYYELDPVIANLNEPSVTRYVSASLTFEMNGGFDEKDGRELFDEKKSVIVNWITIYLSSLTIDDIRGDKNLMTIKSRICESLNDMLFPDEKPKIKEVLIQKFIVQ